MDQAQQEFQVALDMARRGRELGAGEADPVQPLMLGESLKPAGAGIAASELAGLEPDSVEDELDA